ncbi:MFS transporter [Kribbella sp. NPDC026596]|uniref:MFS transporter n=1 Tax=Kribbella sp. NPDC026596 TaxID=3155122 RepID=UPI0033FFAC73
MTSSRSIRNRKWAGGRALWQLAGFARLTRIRSAAVAGDGIFHASLAGAVFFNPEHATTAGRAAAGFAVLLLPYSLIGPLAGVLLDHWRRTRVLAACTVLRAALVTTAAGLLVTTGPSGPMFYLVALVAVSAGRLFNAAASAALPRVVPPAQLVPANSVWTALGTAATVVGGALGLAPRVLGASGDVAAAVAAVAAAAVYALVFLMTLRFDRDALGPTTSMDMSAVAIAAGAWREVVAGARTVAAHRQAAAALVAIGVDRFFYGISTIATLLLYRNYFTDAGLLRAGMAGAAQVVAASIVGAVLAAAITPAITRRWSKRAWITTLYGVAAAVEVAFGLPYRMAPLLVAALLLGLVAQGTQICVQATLQEHVTDDFRGRVFSFYDTLFNATFVAAAAVAAVALPDNGKSYPMLTVIACGYAAVAIGYPIATHHTPTGGTDAAHGRRR